MCKPLYPISNKIYIQKKQGLKTTYRKNINNVYKNNGQLSAIEKAYFRAPLKAIDRVRLTQAK